MGGGAGGPESLGGHPRKKLFQGTVSTTTQEWGEEIQRGIWEDVFVCHGAINHLGEKKGRNGGKKKTRRGGVGFYL